jgi:hypothetical protein
MSDAMRLVRQRAGGILAVILFYVLVPADLHAQTKEEAEAVATSLAICKDKEAAGEDEGEDQFEPCEQYIDANIRDNADTVKWMLEQIENRKSYAQQVSISYYARDEIVQWIIVILSLLTTISAAITKLYPKLSVRGVDFALAPIILSSMIAAVTSIAAYYQYDEYRRLSQNMADDLAELEADMHFLVLRHVAGQQEGQVNEDTINDWHERLRTIMQRYSQHETGNGV